MRVPWMDHRRDSGFLPWEILRTRATGPSFDDDDVEGEMHIERDLSYFDTEDEAIEVAQQWAFAWICEREANVESTQAGTATSRSCIPAETPSR